MARDSIEGRKDSEALRSLRQLLWDYPRRAELQRQPPVGPVSEGTALDGRSAELLNQVGFAEGFKDAVVEFAFVETGLRLGFHGDGHFASHLSQIGHRVPCAVKLVPIGGKGEFHFFFYRLGRSLSLAAWAASASEAQARFSGTGPCTSFRAAAAAA